MTSVLVNVDVPDLDAATPFYRDGPGFAARRRMFGGAVAERETGNLRLYLIRREAGTPAFLGDAVAD